MLREFYFTYIKVAKPCLYQIIDLTARHTIGLPLKKWIIGHNIVLFYSQMFFYVIFTPIACIVRWRGNGSLPIRFDRNLQTYWIIKPPKASAKENLEKQF